MKDPDGSAARKIVDLLVAALSARLNVLSGSSAMPVEAPATAAVPNEAAIANPEAATAQHSDEPSSSESQSPGNRQGEEAHGEDHNEDSASHDPAAEI